MGRRRRATFCAGFLPLLLLGATFLPFTEAHATHVPCGPAGGESQTLLVTGRARVYEVSRLSGSIHVSLIFSCAVRGKPTLLGSPVKTSYKGKFLPAVDTKSLLLRVPWLGYVQTNSGPDTQTMTVMARNLHTGAVEACSVGGSRAPEPGPAVTGLVLRSNGSLAWIGMGNLNPSSILGPMVRRVAECGQNGTTILDEGEGIDLNSLTLRNSVLHWTDSGNPRTAVLP